MSARSPSFSIGPENLTAEHVRDLPLHDVTEQFGTLGLYFRLEDTLAATGLSEVPEVIWATQFGLTLHANDRRSNGHYADHLLRVTLRILEKYKITDPDIIIASMMHDGPEDHAKDIVRILAKEEVNDEREARSKSFELLTKPIGERAVHIVRCVTNPIIEPGQDKLVVYKEHTERLVREEPEARVDKLSDFVDNGVGNHYTAEEMQERLDRKYIDLYQIHRAGLFMPDSLITGDERLYALKQLSEGHARALARLSMLELTQ